MLLEEEKVLIYICCICFCFLFLKIEPFPFCANQNWSHSRLFARDDDLLAFFFFFHMDLVDFISSCFNCENIKIRAF